MAHILVWDLETIPDLKGFAAANGHDGKTEDEIREALGDKFPKHIYHSIICIGAFIAHQDDDRWVVDALGAPHVGERSERKLIAAFVERIAQLNPQLVTFNGSSFYFRSCAIVQWSTNCPRLACRQGRTFIDLPMTLSIYAMSCRRLHPERRRPCTKYVG